MNKLAEQAVSIIYKGIIKSNHAGKMLKLHAGRRAGQMSDVVIYTKQGCPFCAAAKEDFESRGQAYIEHVVTADSPLRDKVIELAGVPAVPVIVRGDDVQVGFGGS